MKTLALILILASLTGCESLKTMKFTGSASYENEQGTVTLTSDGKTVNTAILMKNKAR